MHQNSDILQTWMANSQAWIDTIDHQEIVSRQVATNAAILRAVQQTKPKRVLDVGCGEGWLCRALQQTGISMVGIDGVPALISAAQARGGGPSYQCFSYDQLRQEALAPLGPFDAIVFNFALFEADPTFELLNKLRPWLQEQGHIIIQTLGLANDEPAAWHTEDWTMMKRTFPAPFPWYYRTLADWQQGFQQNNWQLVQYEAIRHPASGALLSWIFTVA